MNRAPADRPYEFGQNIPTVVLPLGPFNDSSTACQGYMIRAREFSVNVVAGCGYASVVYWNCFNTKHEVRYEMLVFRTLH